MTIRFIALTIILLTSKGEAQPSISFSPSEATFVPQENDTTLLDEERRRCGEIIDMHLHPSNYTSVTPIVAEMDQNGISVGVLYSVYAGGNAKLPDPNEQVSNMVTESKGRMYGLASLNTTGNWNDTKDLELKRLITYLNKPAFVGAKLGPPHTCLPLNSGIMTDVVHAVSESNTPVLAIHTGTTPFCGPFGEVILGYRGCCTEEFVDPAYLKPLIDAYSNVTFVLLHSGFDFLPPGDEFFYGGELVSHAIHVAVTSPNVWLEMSALFPSEPDGRPRNPTGSTVLEAIKEAGIADRVLYGSDANFPTLMGHALSWAVEAMVDAGFTGEERCSALSKSSHKLFRIRLASPQESVASEDVNVPDENGNGPTSSSISLFTNPISLSACASLVLLFILTDQTTSL